MKNKILTYVLLMSLLAFIPFKLKAKDDDDDGNKTQHRVAISLEYEPINKLNISLTPELRYNNWTLNKYLLELGADYDFSKWFAAEGTYYVAINKREKKGNEYQYKYKIGPVFEKKISNLKTGIKMYYSNYSDEDENSDFFRFKYFAKYKFKKPGITPGIGAEYYYDLSDKGNYKIRYTAGISYELFKHNSIEISYKLDNFYTDDVDKNIYEINYKFEF